MSADAGAAERIAELENDNRRLRRLLDQRNAPAELRHRLRNTLALFRSVMRKTAETSKDSDAYVAHLQDRFDALARAQFTIDERGTVELHALIAAELLHYGASEGKRASIDGPDVELQPRAGLLFALAIHELTVNSIEHGVLGSDVGSVEIEWHVSQGEAVPLLVLTWKERSVADHPPLRRQGFGTDVLTRMLHYELEANASLAFEGKQLRWLIQVPLSERVAWREASGSA